MPKEMAYLMEQPLSLNSAPVQCTSQPKLEAAPAYSLQYSSFLGLLYLLGS